MVLRTFFAFDNDNLAVSANPNGGVAIGSGIINNIGTPNGTEFTYTAGGGTTITVDDNGGNPDIFEDQDAFNHEIIDGGGLVANGQDVESESVIELRELDAAGNPIGPIITIYVFSEGNVSAAVWGFATTVPLQDGVSYVKVGGNNAGSSAYADYITCFGPGTDILTADGLRDVATINTGDMVWTLQSGYQPVRWVSRTEVLADGVFAPVVFSPGAIGNEKELIVSPEHRMFRQDGMAEVLFGSSEFLIAAKHLCGLPGVARRVGGRITYTHFMFDTHQVVEANGVYSESFFLSSHSVSGIAADQRRELLALFPSLQHGMGTFGDTAAMSLKGFEAALYREHLMAA